MLGVIIVMIATFLLKLLHIIEWFESFYYKESTEFVANWAFSIWH